MHIVELISTGDGQIMETLDNIGIKLFVLGYTERKLVVLLGYTERKLVVSLFFCFVCAV
jgi:hypothetical protein